MDADPDGLVSLCLAGDVMTGRGVDQILRHPGDPALHEPWARSARTYLELAERASGPIPTGVDPAYPWGEVLDVLEAKDPDAFVVNLETAVTDRGDPWPAKGIHYRMHPDNVSVLTAAGVDVAVLSNNHVMDWSTAGLIQTVETLHSAGVRTTGAGRDDTEAWTPAVVESGSGRVVVFGTCSGSSGVPTAWAAGPGRPGVALLPDLSETAVDRIAESVGRHARPGDVVVLSIHWGENWGYGIEPARLRFARDLVDRAGVHVVHGHSPHHPVGLEVHHHHTILYGCGDLVTDYEGITGREEYRGSVGALYLPTVDRATGRTVGLDVVPTRMERFRLVHPPEEDVGWLAAVLARESARLGTAVRRPAGSPTLVVET